MEFSTKVVEKMAEIMAKEIGNLLPDPKGVREVETGMREMLLKVGVGGLKRYMEPPDEGEPQDSHRLLYLSDMSD